MHAMNSFWSGDHDSISEKGVLYNVTVYATNGRGMGSITSGVYYAEEDCECLFLLQEFL